MPTWAVFIILTSLAPSPMARVVNLFFLIIQTISCFCLGVTRQQMIESKPFTNSNNSCSEEGINKSSPVITKQHFLSEGNCDLRDLVLLMLPFQITTTISSLIMPQDLPMLMAVYFLSPVSIHTLIPAYLSLEIVVCTLSWSLSSIAVIPINYIYLSRMSSS